MFVLMGTTRGDRLVSSRQVPLFASTVRSVVEDKKAWHESEMVRYAGVIDALPAWGATGVYRSFDVVECVDDSLPAAE